MFRRFWIHNEKGRHSLIKKSSPYSIHTIYKPQARYFNTMKKEKAEYVKMDLYNKNYFILCLASWVYEKRDKDRFGKMNRIVDKFSMPVTSDEIIPLLNEYIPENTRWRSGIIEIYETYKAMYNVPQTKTQHKNSIRFIKASVKLHFKIDEVLNRVDVLGIAYILRVSEYDIYTERITEDLANPKLKTAKKIKLYIIDNIVRGNTVTLDELGYWGDFSNVQYVPTILLTDYENETISTEDSSLFINKKRRGRGPKRVRLEERIDWGAEEIHKLLTDYRKKYQSFY